MAKTRKAVPPVTSDELLYVFDRTCCVCQDPNIGVQIHHLDGDPSSNEIENLAALCLRCHDQASKTGGLTRSLSKGIIKKYRAEWLRRVQRKRSIAIEPESTRTPEFKRIQTYIDVLMGDVPTDDLSSEDQVVRKFADCDREDAILQKKSIHLAGQPFLDRGSTMDQGHAVQMVVSGYKELILRLTEFYPEGHFGRDSAEEYLFRLVDILADWSYLSATPTHGLMGTMHANDATFRLCSLLDTIAKDMLRTLSWYHLDEWEIIGDESEWVKAWKAAEV